MANEVVIDHIYDGGVLYEFVDSTARKDIADVDKKIYDNNEDLIAKIDAEETARINAITAIENGYVAKDGTKVLSDINFTQAIYNQITQPAVFTGATASANGEKGIVPQPLIADKNKFLKGDGSWSDPADTTYAIATQTANGLMSAADKLKLDTMDTENDSLVPGTVVFGNNSITETLNNGKVNTTTFNGNVITQTVVKTGVDPITIVTTINSDGSITRTRG